jgi:hypothetical protein
MSILATIGADKEDPSNRDKGAEMPQSEEMTDLSR